MLQCVPTSPSPVTFAWSGDGGGKHTCRRRQTLRRIGPSGGRRRRRGYIRWAKTRGANRASARTRDHDLDAVTWCRWSVEWKCIKRVKKRRRRRRRRWLRRIKGAADRTAGLGRCVFVCVVDCITMLGGEGRLLAGRPRTCYIIVSR